MRRVKENYHRYAANVCHEGSDIVTVGVVPTAD